MGMATIFKHEIKTYIKTLLIWFACVGGMGFTCILLFSNLKESMGGMAESFASMGAFADAFGMSQLSIATLEGFYSTEVGTIHALGGAMFAAIICTSILSKEEDGHTSEYLYSMPITRAEVVTAKLLAAITHIAVLNVACVVLYYIGIIVLGEDISFKEFFIYHLMQFFMNIEIAGICFCISSFMKKNKIGIGLGIVLMLYAFDLIARVIPDLDDYKVIGPFSYSNAADIFSGEKLELLAVIIGLSIFITTIVLAYVKYNKKDLAS